MKLENFVNAMGINIIQVIKQIQSTDDHDVDTEHCTEKNNQNKKLNQRDKVQRTPIIDANSFINREWYEKHRQNYLRRQSESSNHEPTQNAVGIENTVDYSLTRLCGNDLSFSVQTPVEEIDRNIEDPPDSCIPVIPCVVQKQEKKKRNLSTATKTTHDQIECNGTMECNPPESSEGIGSSIDFQVTDTETIISDQYENSGPKEYSRDLTPVLTDENEKGQDICVDFSIVDTHQVNNKDGKGDLKEGSDNTKDDNADDSENENKYPKCDVFYSSKSQQQNTQWSKSLAKFPFPSALDCDRSILFKPLSAPLNFPLLSNLRKSKQGSHDGRQQKIKDALKTRIWKKPKSVKWCSPEEFLSKKIKTYRDACEIVNRASDVVVRIWKSRRRTCNNEELSSSKDKLEYISHDELWTDNIPFTVPLYI